MEVREIETPHGPARAHIDASDGAPATLVLGHGAGGGVEAVDLVAATEVARGAGLAVVRVEQPYGVAGRKAPGPAHQLDAAWIAVVEDLRAHGPLGDGKLVAGGRSMGARVACRTAAEAGAGAVLCLAFPVHPPGKADDPAKSRQGELDAVAVPTLVIQGESDPFGMPVASPGHEVVTVAGNHGLKADLAAVSAAIARWLPRVAG